MISLYEWAKREGISYSHAQKLLGEGKIEGAVRTSTGKRIKIPITTKLLPRDTVICAICGRSFPQITGTHLKLHRISWEDYRAQYPDVPTITEELSAAISSSQIGKEIPEEQRKKISNSKMGSIPWNKGLVGVQIPTDETRQKMAEAHTGLKHTEEAKAKIGDAHRGKRLSDEQVASMSERMFAFFKENTHPFLGKHHTEEILAKMKVAARQREEHYTKDERAAINEAIGNGVRGIKRTDEQKETYRAARCKWMSENPLKVANTSGERTIAAWLDEKGIRYRRQFRIKGLHHPFDFYLPDFNTIIEFDGCHHWHDSWFSKRDVKAQVLQERIREDGIQNVYAGRSGYRIIRIYGKADVGDCQEWPSLEEQLALQGFTW